MLLKKTDSLRSQSFLFRVCDRTQRRPELRGKRHMNTDNQKRGEVF